MGKSATCKERAGAIPHERALGERLVHLQRRGPGVTFSGSASATKDVTAPRTQVFDGDVCAFAPGSGQHLLNNETCARSATQQVISDQVYATLSKRIWNKDSRYLKQPREIRFEFLVKRNTRGHP